MATDKVVFRGFLAFGFGFRMCIGSSMLLVFVFGFIKGVPCFWVWFCFSRVMLRKDIPFLVLLFTCNA